MTTPPDTGLTVEKRAELRLRVETQNWPTFDRDTVLSLLDALDAADRELATLRRSSEHMLAGTRIALDHLNYRESQGRMLTSREHLWLETERAHLTDEVDSLNAESGELRRKFNTAADDCEYACNERDELKLKVSSLEAETMTLTSERDTARMTQEELRRKLEEAEARVLKERDAGVACYEETVREGRLRDAVVEAARVVFGLLTGEHGTCGVAPMNALRDALSALDQPSKPEPTPSGEREIKVGSTWLETERDLLSQVLCVSNELGVRVSRVIRGKESRCWFGFTAFRRLFEFVSDPPEEPKL